MPDTHFEAAANRLRRIVIWIVAIIVFGIGVTTMALGPTLTTDENLRQVLRTLGSFLTVTILLGFLYRVTVGPYDNAKHEERIRTLLYQEIDRVYSAAKGYGFSGIQESLDFNDVFNGIKKNETLWWLDTYHPTYKEWLDSAENALKNGAHVKMLIMSPKSPMLQYRATELGSHYEPEVFREELMGFRSRMTALSKRYPELFEIREYNDLPCAPIYIVSAAEEPLKAYSSYFLSHATGVKFPHLVWREGEHSFLKELFAYVKGKWDRSTPVD